MTVVVSGVAVATVTVLPSGIPSVTVTLPAIPPASVLTGVQGPSGPRGATGLTGPMGPAGDGSFTLVASTPIGGHRLVATDGAGGIAYASCDDASSLPSVLGMTLHAAASSESVAVQRTGEIVEGSWNWSPGLPVYLGLAGVPTQTLPPSAVFGLIVGIPSTSTTLFMAPREPILFD